MQGNKATREQVFIESEREREEISEERAIK